MLRSCYLSDMVLSSGGPHVSGGWYFTDSSPWPLEHTLGSLNYYKGNSEAVFSGVGEVSRGAWRDGSALPCVPGVPCFSSVYNNYDIVEFSTDNGASWFPMVQVATDYWTALKTYAGVSFGFRAQCGIISGGLQGLRLTKEIAPFPSADYPGTAYSTSYPATWTFPTVAGSPPSWPGYTVLIRTRCDDNFITSQRANGINANSLSLTPTSPHDGNSLIAMYFQNGTDVSGAAGLPTPSISSGFTLLHSSADKRFYIWAYLNAPHSTSCTVSGIHNADLQDLFLTEIVTRPSASIVDQKYHDNVAAATVLTTDTVTFSGDDAGVYACLAQIRNAATSQGAPTLSGVLPPFGLQNPDSRVTAGGTPVFETLMATPLTGGAQHAGSYHAGLTSSRSLQYFSGILAIR